MKQSERPQIRGVAVHPLADLGLPLALNLQTAVAVWLAALCVRAVAGRQLLPGPGWWALLVATESCLFTGYFFVREVDRPQLLRYVEAAVLLLLGKVVTTAPAVGWGLRALTELQLLEPWVGLPLLAVAWWLGGEAASLCGALHPGLAPKPGGGERVLANPHGDAFAALKRRVVAVAGWATALVGLLPLLARGYPLHWGVSGRTILVAILAAALLAALSLALAARLRQEIDWLMEGLTPPEGVLDGWLPHAVGLLLLPLLLAAFLPAGPRLPIERLLPEPAAGDPEYLPPPSVELPDASPPPAIDLSEWLERMAPAAVTLPAWVHALVTAILWALGLLLALIVLRTAWRQVTERMGGGGGLLPMLRALLRWYVALAAALWTGLRGGAATAGRALAEAAGSLAGGAGGLGRRLPRWGRPPGEPRAAVRYYFARLQADAARRGVARDRGATAREFGAAVGPSLPGQEQALREFVTAYEEARYGPDPVPPSEADRARRLWQRLTQALGKRT